jgi:soluble lytic murein transglycosylase-like protein
MNLFFFPVFQQAIYVRRLLIGLFTLIPATGQAQVLEIGNDGQATWHDRPAVYLGPTAVAQPILSARTTPQGRPPLSNDKINRAISVSAAAHGISRDLAYAVAWHESRLRPDVVSPKGAIGVMQLMPATARSLRVDPYDAVSNIEGGVTFLSRLMQRYDGDLVKTLAAYSAGPGAVDRYRGVPPYRETQAYVASILGSLAKVVTP